MKQAFIGIAIGLIAFMGVFGVSVVHQAVANGALGSCPYMGDHTAMPGPMTFYHIGIWQGLFTSDAVQAALLLALILVTALIALVRATAFDVRDERSSIRIAPVERSIPPPSFLEFVFSQGILHSRVYAA